jgi:hypothetical protein
MLTMQRHNSNIFFIMWKFLLYYYCYFLNALCNHKPLPPPQKSLSELCTDYIEKEKKKFLEIYSNEDANYSIDPVFYNEEEYKKTMASEENLLEKYWQSRILFENTPRGNIIMYYDAYKLGFAYYSDISGLPYSLLNAVSMKYVRIYKCRDFFIDTHITPEPSPFIRKPQKKEESKNPATIPKSKAFAKLKTYNNASGKVSNENESTMNFSNTMINNGRIQNFSFLKKATPIRKKILSFSYQDYKKQFKNYLADEL